jgi:hypothetical protein
MTDVEPDLRRDSTTQPARQPVRFNLQSLLWLTVVAALVLTCLIQSQKLRTARSALARNAWASSEVAIPKGKFRLMVNKIIDDDRDTKVCVIRIEANEEHYVSAGGQSSITTAANVGGMHWAEIQIFASYDSTTRRMTSLTRVKSGSGWAGGQAIYTLPPNAKPDEFVRITVKPGLYDLTQPVEIGSIEGKPVTVTVK